MTTAAKAYRELISSGLSDKQAEAIIDVVQFESDQHVTKEQLDGALSKQKAEIVMWLGAMLVAQFAGMIGVMLALIKYLKP
jgi:hypothetical protein